MLLEHERYYGLGMDAPRQPHHDHPERTSWRKFPTKALTTLSVLACQALQLKEVHIPRTED